MKRIALVGHRGVGKTTFLKRIEKYLPDAMCLDLDAEVAARSGREITEIFLESEEAFRELERTTLAAIEREIAMQAKNVYIAIGAGFDPRNLGSTWRVWWIRRMTDEGGRIFTTRPRLNKNISALDEYRERYLIRKAGFAERADETLILEEGAEDSFDLAERAFVREEVTKIGGALTVLKVSNGFKAWLEKRLAWGVQYFELRDDLLTASEMSEAAKLIPVDKLLLSFRDPARRKMTQDLINEHQCRYDASVENGSTDAPILSLHERRGDEALEVALGRLSSGRQLLKAALPVHNFAELEAGHRWQVEDPDRRIFLPHSSDGRWYWYRLWRARKQPLGFFREDDGSGKDQPTLLEWMNAAPYERFAAVLGDPVRHSRTPLEQRSFFSERGLAVFSIRMTLAELQNGALEILNRLGLDRAAITSPLKSAVYAMVSGRDEAAKRVAAINTLDLRGNWRGTNTDIDGLRVGIREALVDIADADVAVWGGGGTLEVIREVLPRARCFSVRTGKNRDHSSDVGRPRAVVWAAPRPVDGVQSPPPEWRPEMVFDLNYNEDSAGRAYAQAVGARYVSGLGMFRAQAAKQREFWSHIDERC